MVDFCLGNGRCGASRLLQRLVLLARWFISRLAHEHRRPTILASGGSRVKRARWKRGHRNGAQYLVLRGVNERVLRSELRGRWRIVAAFDITLRILLGSEAATRCGDVAAVHNLF